jgi:hypothetical protein
VAPDPADADALSDCPVGDAFAEGVDDAGDFVTGDARVDDSREKALLRNDVAMTDSAGCYFHADFARGRIGDGAVEQFDGTVRGGDLGYAHDFHDAGRAITSQQVEIVIFLQLVSGVGRGIREARGEDWGMKKYIREMIEDLKRPKGSNDFIPPVPKGAKEDPVVELTPPPEPSIVEDLSNQELSKNAEEKVKQLDYQAQQSERLQTNS